VAGYRNVFLHEDAVVAEGPCGFGAAAFMAAASSSGEATMRMPLPPPPAAGFKRSGSRSLGGPQRSSRSSSDLRTPVHGHPAFIASASRPLCPEGGYGGAEVRRTRARIGDHFAKAGFRKKAVAGVDSRAPRASALEDLFLDEVGLV